MERIKRPKCPYCGEPLEAVVIQYSRLDYTIARTRYDEEDFGVDDLGWARDAYCCPNCLKEIEENLAEKVFDLNESLNREEE